MKELRIEDYTNKTFDTRRDAALVSILLEKPEDERFLFITELLDKNVLLGLKVANYCLRDKEYFLYILQRGLKEGDASSIRFWLESVIPRLGLQKVFRILYDTIQSNPDAVRKAIYWIPILSPLKSQKEISAYNEVKQMLKDFA